jgi:anti-sigma factor RsiW
LSIEINISNYESYLLSYIDGELNEAEQAALELFLQKHPQFQQELDLLEGVRVVPDETIVFENKAALYRTTSVDTIDYEELMLSYIDGELTPAEEQTLQVYLAQQPAAQKDLSLLQATKLTADTNLVFGDKTSLYRSTERRVAPMYRRIGWGAAAAAVVAGLVIWLLPANQSQQPPTYAANKTAPAAVPATTTTAPANAAPAPEIAATPVVVPAAASPRKEQPLLAKANKTAATHEKKSTVATAAPVKTTDVATNTVAPKADVPVMSQLPPQRNSVDELVEKHLQKAEDAHIAATAAKPDANKEAVMASTASVTNTTSTNKIAAATTQPGIQGELIMSVSGSDSKILDKVTNVAKFFSRKRNK